MLRSEYFKQLKKQLGVTNQQIADLTKPRVGSAMSKETIDKYSQGKRRPSPAVLRIMEIACNE